MKKLLLYWGPVLILMGLIFYSSAQPYSEQDIRPLLHDAVSLEWVSTYFSDLAFYYAGEEVSVHKLGEAGYIEFFIRKGTHVIVYLILAVLLYRAFRNSFEKHASIISLSLLTTCLYAVSDEIHQGFTVQRSPHVEDIVLDSVGAIIGVFLAHYMLYKKSGLQTKRQLRNEKN